MVQKHKFFSLGLSTIQSKKTFYLNRNIQGKTYETKFLGNYYWIVKFIMNKLSSSHREKAKFSLL